MLLQTIKRAALVLPFVAAIFLLNPATAFAKLPAVSVSDSFYVDKEVRAIPLRKDARVEILKAYLESQGSPMAENARDFVEAADRYDMDWKLVAAIAGLESNYGKRTPGNAEFGNESYNAWGWGVYGDKALGLGSWRNGIYTVTRGLRENYINKGYTEPLSMNRKYASSPTWGVRVNFILGKMTEFEKNYAVKTEMVLERSYFDSQTAGESARPFRFGLGDAG